MASSARFGRLPRTAPSLTSTIVAMAQQYQNQRDQNIETAWKNGGLFEGKKVTDEMYLAHWKQRMADVSPEDPMYDYYRDKIYGIEFNIAESKMSLKYARKDVTDQQMAQFYMSWAKKMPQNSANWRDLMTQAAKFKAAAAARASGNSARAAAQAYYNAQDATYKTHVLPGDAIAAGVSAVAEGMGLIDRTQARNSEYGWDKMTAMNGGADGSTFFSLLQTIESDPNLQKQLTTYIRDRLGFKDFDGRLDEDHLVAIFNDARNGAQTMANRALKTGHSSDYKAYMGKVDDLSRRAVMVRVTMGTDKTKGFLEQDSFMRAQTDQLFSENSNATPVEQAALLQGYQTWLSNQGRDALLASFPPGTFELGNPNFNEDAATVMGALQNTVASLGGQVTGRTLQDDPFGLGGAEIGSKLWADRANGVNHANWMIAVGGAKLVQVNSQGNPDPNGQGWAVITNGDSKLNGQDLIAMPYSGGQMGLQYQLRIPYTDPKTGQQKVGSLWTPYAATTVIDPSGGLMEDPNNPGQPLVLGGAKGETRWMVSAPIYVRGFGAADQNTAQPDAATQLKPVVGMDDHVADAVTWQAGDGTSLTLYGVWQGGARTWTTVPPFASDPTTGRVPQAVPDGKGGFTVNYLVPGAIQQGPSGNLVKQPFNPFNMIDQGTLASPSNTVNWNPESDKQSGFESPFEAAIHANDQTYQWVGQHFSDDVLKSTTIDWYVTHQNEMPPSMKAQVQAGMPIQQVASDRADLLIRQLDLGRQAGYSPEQRNNYAQSMAAMQLARTGQTGQTVQGLQNEMRNAGVDAAAAAQRQELIDNMTKWSQTGSMPMNPLFGTLINPLGLMNMAGTAKTAIPAGWTVQQLLTQPGMTFQQANIIANQISGGAVGVMPTNAPGVVTGGAPAPPVTPGGVRAIPAGFGKPTNYTGNPAASLIQSTLSQFLPAAGAMPSSFTQPKVGNVTPRFDTQSPIAGYAMPNLSNIGFEGIGKAPKGSYARVGSPNGMTGF